MAARSSICKSFYPIRLSPHNASATDSFMLNAQRAENNRGIACQLITISLKPKRLKWLKGQNFVFFKSGISSTRLQTVMKARRGGLLGWRLLPQCRESGVRGSSEFNGMKYPQSTQRLSQRKKIGEDTDICQS